MKTLTLTPAVVVSLAFGMAFVAVAQDAVEAIDGSHLVGLPVFAKDGTEVGEVIAQGEIIDAKPATITVSAARTLGIGERTFDVAEENYVGLQGAVTLDMMSDEIDQLPEPDR